MYSPTRNHTIITTKTHPLAVVISPSLSSIIRIESKEVGGGVFRMGYHR